MTGLGTPSKGGGAFAFSLLAHGALIAGLAAFAEPRLTPPQSKLAPLAVTLIPASAVSGAGEAPPPAPAPTPPPPMETVLEPPPPAPAPTPPPPMETVLEPPPPAPEAPSPLPSLEPKPLPPVAAPKAPPRPLKIPAKPSPKPSTKPELAAPPPQTAAVDPQASNKANFEAISLPLAQPEPAAGPPAISEARFRTPPAKPIYPQRAADLEQQGETLVRVLVGPDGEQIEVRLWQSSGFDLLDRAAMAAVRRWHFEPYRRDGVAYSTWVQVPVRFILERS